MKTTETLRGTSPVLSLLTLISACCGSALAEIPANPDAQSRIVGQPSSIEVAPSNVRLEGPRATRQIVVTGNYADGTVRDLTRFCRWTVVDSDAIVATSQGLISAQHDGDAELKIEVAGRAEKIPVKTIGLAQPRPVSFRREVMPLLSVAGCSDIRCHGSPSGKEGFRLSLWGSDPALDIRQLCYEMHARRTNSLQPERSLILKKALGRVPHVGGRRFPAESFYADLLRQWQTEQSRDDADPVQLASLVITPAERILHAPARWQQLAAVATFTDGTSADVTRLTAFSSSDLSIANVDRSGLVEFSAQGEVAILCRFMGHLESIRLAHIAAPASDYRWPDPPEYNDVDRHVFAKLKLMNIAPSDLCTDEQFVRRIFIDLCGMLPPADVAASFAADTDPEKRSRLVDRLLQRREFSEFWSKKWLDVLRVSRDAVQWKGADTFHSWLKEQIHQDASFAQIVQQMLVSTGRSFSNGPANFYCVTQIPMGADDPRYLQKDLAEATAQLFMGVRLQCARCHNHPYEGWKQQDFLGLAAHFTQVKRERLGKAGPAGRAERREFAVSLDVNGAEITNEISGAVVPVQLPGQPASQPQPGADRREVLAAWLTGPDNPFFAKAIVNRVWYHLNGRGIVEPVDDFRDSNPPANEALLNALAKEFADNEYRLKPLIRTIVRSRTWQLSSIPNAGNADDDRYFSHMTVRPLPAEVLLDSIGDVTGVREKFQITADYTIGVPEGFVDLPEDTRAVQLPVNDIVTLINTSSKYVRYESHEFLRAFGQPTRTQTCECDREQHFGRKQALELIIGDAISKRLTSEKNRLSTMLAGNTPDRKILNAFYLHALSRLPAESTAGKMLAHVASARDRRQAWEDVLWVILNSQEFIYQH